MLPVSGPHASPAAITTIAQAAERLDYDSLWTYERVLRPIAPVWPGPDGTLGPAPEIYRTTYEPLQTLSHVAALTSRITLGTSIITALLHPPVVLARRFATLDQFSGGGRVIAGFGQGSMAQEYATANIPWKRRGAGMDDIVAAIRAAWGPDPVEYEGRFYSIEPSEINPKPVHGDIPIVMGAFTDAGIDRAARIADGITPVSLSLDDVTRMTTRFRTEAERLGRDAAALTVTAQSNSPMVATADSGDHPYLGGTPKQIAADIEPLRERGVDAVMFAWPSPEPLDVQIELLEELRTLVPRA
ncbi:putative F420-dependent oxidoreductase, Rv2161c family [Promicromonospora thailandica]|uniref:F420-dependent oxidoreductase, Rv2161c family n=2 Tax=Promicromonospora thailandica TaxID=765201 RepID=A0A9X2GBV0_9MICO|nr:putative F420-dependent oxidoreductase, Rv2161c family [Promicromonospora thailandica]